MRTDQSWLLDFIPQNSNIIDIGCGEGDMLNTLIQQKNIAGHGIEIDSENVAKALAKGLSVIQGNGDDDLIHYTDNSFDIAILALTLQVMRQPKEVLLSALRIAKQVVVVIPNFGQWVNRYQLMVKGKMPVTKQLSYAWYETPNIHFCTIQDFTALCHEIGATINACQGIQGNKVTNIKPNSEWANLRCSHAIYVLSKTS